MDQTRTSTSRSAEAVDFHIGAKIRNRRKELKLSQEQLGNVAGVSFQQIQKYENGANRISASMLVKIAGALDVPPTWFFEDLPAGIEDNSEASRAEAERQQWLASETGRTWVEAGRKLPVHAVASLVRVADMVVEAPVQ